MIPSPSRPRHLGCRRPAAAGIAGSPAWSPARSPARSHAGSLSGGFSLVELLIAGTLGVVLVAALASVILSYTRSRERIEAISRLQDQWGRVQFLLDQEIQESRPTTLASVSIPAACPAQASSAPVLLLAPPEQSVPIVYYRDGSTLRRCGAQVSANGLLSSSVSDHLILRNVSSFAVDLSDSERPRYTLTLTDRRGYSYTNGSQPSGGISRIRFIH